MLVELSEAEVKNACEEYLQYAMNQGKLWFSRMNAGDFIETRGDSRRRIKGAGKGTSDLIVIQSGQVHLEYMGEQHGPGIPVGFVTFIELKSSDGKLRPEQIEFQAKVEALNCRYAIVRSVEDLQEVLKRE